MLLSELMNLRPAINRFAAKHKFSSKKAEAMLLDTDFATMPIINSLVSFGTSYLKIHDVYKRARKPLESDGTDLQHLRNVPYVDCFVTDKFVNNYAKTVALNTYNTNIFQNLSELQDWLENSLVK